MTLKLGAKFDTFAVVSSLVIQIHQLLIAAKEQLRNEL